MKLKQFEKQQFMNIETFRKNGQGVKTPVWFAQDGNTLHVWTEANTGKAKRIRRDGKVRIAPATASGEALGEWITAKAQTNETPEAVKYTEKLMRKKYGIMFPIFGLLGKLRGGKKYISIRIEPTG
jgi:PPOX class probable F420-dependent enzyme